MAQLNLDLPVRPASGRGDFFVSPANALALAAVDGWRDWPGGKLALIGPEGAGKTHLTHVWAEAAGARILPAAALLEAVVAAGASPATRDGNLAVEDVEQIAGDAAAEQALLHLHNLVLAEGGRLLLTGTTPPARWPIALPDLASRLAATPVARLEPPDDALLAALLVKLFADRGIAAPPALVAFLVPRMERSSAAAGRLVAALDARALATGRSLGPRLAAEVLDGDPAGAA
jgi:chromosomal replication initiation ATPase DnaA